MFYWDEWLILWIAIFNAMMVMLSNQKISGSIASLKQRLNNDGKLQTVLFLL